MGRRQLRGSAVCAETLIFKSLHSTPPCSPGVLVGMFPTQTCLCTHVGREDGGVICEVLKKKRAVLDSFLIEASAGPRSSLVKHNAITYTYNAIIGRSSRPGER